MSNNRCTSYPEAVEKHLCIAREEIKVIADVRLRGFAEAELVRYDDAISIGRKLGDRPCPIVAGKALAMQERDSFPVCRSIWRDIHIGHAEQLSLDYEIEEVHCIRIVDRPMPSGRKAGACAFALAINAMAPNTSAQYFVRLPRTAWLPKMRS